MPKSDPIKTTFAKTTTKDTGDSFTPVAAAANASTTLVDADGLSICINSVYDSDVDNDDNDNNKKQQSVGSSTCKEMSGKDIYTLSCEEVYVNSGKNKALLLAMCCGVDDCNSDTTLEPYKSSRRRRTFLPQAREYNDEIVRRANVIGLPQAQIPRPKAWPHKKRIEWLEKHKINNPIDIQFLQRELQDFINQLEVEVLNASDDWIGDEPYIRLYHVMMEESVKSSYSTRNEEDYYKVASDLYNNQSYNPYSTAYPELHVYFRIPIHLLASNAPISNPTQIKDKIADVRGKLATIVTNWEQRGGAQNDDDSSAPNDRSNYLEGNKSHLLYFWQKVEEGKIPPHTLSNLRRAISTNSKGVPPYLNSPMIMKRRLLGDGKFENCTLNIAFPKDVKKVLTDLVRSASIAATNSSLQTLISLQSRVLELSQQYENTNSVPQKKRLYKMVQDAEMFYEHAKKKLKETEEEI
jgi:hypothetical protein